MFKHLLIVLLAGAASAFAQTSYFDPGDPIDKGHVYDDAPLYSAYDPFGITLLTNLEARVNTIAPFSDAERTSLHAYSDNTAATNAAAARSYAYALTLPLSQAIDTVSGRVTALEAVVSGGIVTTTALSISESGSRAYASAAAAAALAASLTNTASVVAATDTQLRSYADAVSETAAGLARSDAFTNTAAAVAAASVIQRLHTDAADATLQAQIDALPISTNQLTQLLTEVSSSALSASTTNLEFLAAVGTNVVVTKLQEDPVSWFSVRTAGDDLIARVQVVPSSMMVWTAVFNPGIMDSGTSEFIDTAPMASPYFNRPPEYAYLRMPEYGSVLFYLVDAQNNLEFYSPTNVVRVACVAGSRMKPIIDVYNVDVPQGATCFTNYCRLNNNSGTNCVYAVFTAVPVSTFAITNAVTLNTYVSRMLVPVADSLAESSSGFTNSFVSLSNGLTAANESISNSFATAAALVTQETSRVAAVLTQHVASVSSGITGLVSAVSNDLSVLAGVVVSNSGAIAALSGIVVSNSDYAVQLASNITVVSSNLIGVSVALTNNVAGVADGLTNLITSTEDKLVPTNRTITVNGQIGTLDEDVVLNIDAGVTEPTVTNIAQAVASGYLPLSGGTMTGDITMDDRTIIGKRFGELSGIESSGNAWIAIGGGSGYFSSGDNWFSFGTLSGAYSTGNNWVAIGVESGQRISGSGWSSLGNYSGFFSSGDNWSAIGSYAGSRALGNNWASIGVYSGYNSRGDNRIYVDAYGGNPNYGENGATNDMIFGDNGYLYIGRGLGAPGGQQGGTLRGAWTFNDSLTLFGKTITWNTSRQTFNVPLYGGVVGQLFQEQLMLVRNQTGANIGNGKIVCSAGAVGDNSAIRKASNADVSCAWGVLGMVTQDAGIDHGSDGLICTGGEVNNLPLPTSIYQPSNTLWLATDGNYTNVEPQNVAVKYQIGIVLRAHATEGRIQFHPQFIPSPASIGAASASNATLTGTATINGDVIIGAGGVTNAIIANQQLIANLETIIKDVVISTNVVRVVSTQSVYVATVTSPCVITQDVSALTLATNQTASWMTRINVTDWSATNGITFATNIAAYAGDFTVTGCYDFACSLLCDGRIEMRQTFPTVERSTVTHWNMLNTSTSTELAQPFITASVRTNSVGTYRSRSSDYIISTFTFMGPALTNISSSKLSARALNLAAYTGANYVLPQPRSTASGYIMRVNCSSGNFATDGFSNSRFGASSGYSVGLEISVPVGTGDIYLTGCEQRKMTELEIRAYNKGWRPR